MEGEQRSRLFKARGVHPVRHPVASHTLKDQCIQWLSVASALSEAPLARTTLGLESQSIGNE
jgi:hypothetical protein